MHTFEIQLSDVDRGVYETLSLRVARHPSETELYMVTRVLAYCLEYEEGIAFSAGVSTTDEPAVLVRDLTGAITGWIEIGAPDAARLHLGSKKADRTRVYTHRDVEKVRAPWVGKTIFEADKIVVRSFDDGFTEAIAAKVDRRNDVDLTLSEGTIYFTINGDMISSELHEHPIQ